MIKQIALRVIMFTIFCTLMLVCIIAVNGIAVITDIAIQAILLGGINHFWVPIMPMWSFKIWLVLCVCMLPISLFYYEKYGLPV